VSQYSSGSPYLKRQTLNLALPVSKMKINPN